jgi:tripartite-type tricarboxylate transporter receptor subunit TctC
VILKKRQLLLAASGLAAPVLAQSAYPNAGLRLVVPFAPGGGADTFARLFADRLGRVLRQPIVVENRGGAGGLIAAAEVSRARPDGYTLIFHSPTSGITGPLTRNPPPFDPVTGFAPVSILTVSPLALAVGNHLRVNSLAELVARIREAPGRVTYGSSGIGGAPHLSVELLRMRAGDLDMVHVPYRGGAPALQDIAAGNLAFMVDTFLLLTPQHRDGRVKIVAVLGTDRVAALPDVPTAKEEGFDVVARIVYYLSAPPGTPEDRLQTLAAASRQVMASPEMARNLEPISFTPVTDSGPEAASRFIASEAALWGPVIRAANIPVE